MMLEWMVEKAMADWGLQAAICKPEAHRVSPQQDGS